MLPTVGQFIGEMVFIVLIGLTGVVLYLTITRPFDKD